MHRLLAALGLGLFAWPTVADACEPWVNVSSVYPDEDTTLPVNGIVVVRGSYLDANDFIFFVGGDQVETEAVDRVTNGSSSLSGSRQQNFGFRVAELPAVGSELELRHCPDLGGCEHLGTWTLAEADHEPPAPPSFVQYDYVEITGCGVSSCAPHTIDRLGYVQVEGSSHEPQYVSVRVRNTQEPSEELYLQVGDTLPMESLFQLNDTMSPGAPPEASVCFEVRVFDLAGNEAAYALDTCAPCHIDAEPVVGACSPKEDPQWTDDEFFPGGDCVGVPIDPLPPLPAPSEPARGTGTTGTGSSGGFESSGGVSTTGGFETSGGLETTTGVADTTSTTDASTSTSTSNGSPDPTGGASSGAPGQADPAQGGGCRTGGSNTPPLWLVVMLVALSSARRRRHGDAAAQA